MTQAIAVILIQEAPTTMMSNRDKGLNAALSAYKPKVNLTSCYFHLHKIFTTKFVPGLTEVFWKIARAIESYTSIFELQQLWTYNQSVANHVAEMPAKSLVAAYFVSWRYGQDTSNIVEWVNGNIKFKENIQLLIFFISVE